MTNFTTAVAPSAFGVALDAAFLTQTFQPGNPVAVKASAMGVNFQIESTSTLTLRQQGGIWPNSAAYADHAFNYEFTAANTPLASMSPMYQAANATLFVMAVNSGSGNQTCGIVTDAVANVLNASCYGANPIARGGTTAAVQLVGTEVDQEFAAGGSALSGSAGMFVNTFSVADAGAGIQLGAVGIGAHFTNGFVAGGVGDVNGACFAVQSGTACGAALDASQGTFSNAAIQLAAGQNINFGTSGAVGQLVGSGGNLVINFGASGILAAPNATEGTAFLFIRNSGGTDTVQVENTSGTQGNAAHAGLRVRANSSSSRSINAGGTVNASGADYAEYELKGALCGTVAKGAIVGFDAEGKLTDRWANIASRCRVKSTKPNLVGGDTWHEPAGLPPVAPTPPDPTRRAPEPTQTIRAMHHARRDADHEARMAIWQAEVDQHAADTAAYEAALPIYQAVLATWEAAHEALRVQVDRIAYCGKCPVNITGAKVGQWIVPIEAPDGGITAQAVDDDALTLQQLKRAVGQVLSILEDGRAQIDVR